MKTYTVQEIKEILDVHDKWLHDEDGGERADLRGADLRGADLRGAYLRCAYLRGADLRGADLRSADLQGAKYADEEMLVEYFCIGPMGSRSDYLQVFITDKRVELKTGCFCGSLEQFTEQASEHIIAEHRQSYLAAVEFIKAMVAPKAA